MDYATPRRLERVRARKHIHDFERRYFGGTMRRGWRCWHWAAGDGVRDYNF
jgi:hypothetical protein